MALSNENKDENKDECICSRLFYLIYSDNLELFKSLVKKIDINIALNEFGDTLLHKSVKYKNINFIKYLLENGINVNIIDSYGFNALCYDSVNPEIFEILIDYNIDINMCDEDGITPLIYHTSCLNIEIVKLLLNADAKINHKTNSGNTALMISLSNNDMDVIKLLLMNNADVNIQNNKGETALILAANSENFKGMLLLLDYNADIYIKDNSGNDVFYYVKEIIRKTSAVMHNSIMINDLLISKKKTQVNKYTNYILNIIIEKEKQCPVCYVDFTISNMFIGEICSHPICTICLENVVKCPICRNEKYR